MSTKSTTVRYWSLGRLARHLAVSPFTLRRLERKGLLRTINVGARVLVSLDEVRRVESQGVGTRRQKSNTDQRHRPNRTKTPQRER